MNEREKQQHADNADKDQTTFAAWKCQPKIYKKSEKGWGCL